MISKYTWVTLVVLTSRILFQKPHLKYNNWEQCWCVHFLKHLFYSKGVCVLSLFWFFITIYCCTLLICLFLQYNTTHWDKLRQILNPSQDDNNNIILVPRWRHFLQRHFFAQHEFYSRRKAMQSYFKKTTAFTMGPHPVHSTMLILSDTYVRSVMKKSFLFFCICSASVYSVVHWLCSWVYFFRKW